MRLTPAMAMRTQGLYYMVTGVWPLIHLRSFEAVTRPKTDDWLVHTVGLLAAAIGISLSTAVTRGEHGVPAVRVLAVSSALAFAGIDIWYGLSGRIPAIYLADALVQIVLVVVLLSTAARRAR